jgi:hypothetical protein
MSLKRRLIATSSSIVLACGLTLAAPTAAQAHTAGCTISVTSLSVFSDSSGRWVSAAARLSCPIVLSFEYTHINMSITRNGQFLSLVPNAQNKSSWPGQYRNCVGQKVCTIYVGARASTPTATYKAWANGYLQSGTTCCDAVHATRSLTR